MIHGRYLARASIGSSALCWDSFCCLVFLVCRSAQSDFALLRFSSRSWRRCGCSIRKIFFTALTHIGYELPATPQLSWLGMVNAIAIYLGIIIANLLLIAFLVSGALMIIGIIRIDAALTRQLSGVPAHVLLRLPGNMVITQELLSLSLALGGLAILSFTFVTLSDRQARSNFTSTATSGLRRALFAFTVYQAAPDSGYSYRRQQSWRSTRRLNH